MKCRSLILIFLILSSTLTAGEIYPGRTYTLIPEFYSGFFLPTGSREGGGKGGGGIQTGLSLVDAVPRVSLGFSAGYGFLGDDHSQTLLIPSAGLTGGYRIPLGDLFSLYPGAELSLYWPSAKTGRSMTASLTASSVLDMHVYDRNYISLKMALTLPFSTMIPPFFSLQLGVKHSIPIMRTMPPVSLEVLVQPELFSPDGDGIADVLEIIPVIVNPGSVKSWSFGIFDKTGVLIYSRNGEGSAPSSFAWDGYSDDHILVSSAEDFLLEFELFDLLGNRFAGSRPFVTDVFVFSENGKLKIRVPGIIFPSGSSDFTRLTDEEIEQNKVIIRKIALTLLKFPEYRILIEGHGNLLNWSSEERASVEQREILLPLSGSRAAAVRDALIEEGISPERLDVAGRGGESPLVPFSDERNRWKNRRVEFILLK